MHRFLHGCLRSPRFAYPQPMPHNADLSMLEALPALARLQVQISNALERHVNREQRHHRLLQSPNMVELALVASRGSKRLVGWLQVPNLALQSAQVQVVELLKLRARFADTLCSRQIVPSTRIDCLATYLAVHPCPSVATLSDFAEIDRQTARKWIKTLAREGLLCLKATPRDLHAINPELLSLLSAVSTAAIRQQFEALIRNRHWLKDSRFTLIS